MGCQVSLQSWPPEARHTRQPPGGERPVLCPDGTCPPRDPQSRHPSDTSPAWWHLLLQVGALQAALSVNGSSYPTRQNPLAAALGDLGPSTLDPRAPIMASLLFALPGRPPPAPSAPLRPSSLPAYTSPPASLARCPACCHPARDTGGLDPERPISAPPALAWGLRHTPSSQPHLQMSKPRQKTISDDQGGTGKDSPVQRAAGDGGWRGADTARGNGGHVPQILETALFVFALNRRNVGSEAGKLLCHSWGLPVARSPDVGEGAPRVTAPLGASRPPRPRRASCPGPSCSHLPPSPPWGPATVPGDVPGSLSSPSQGGSRVGGGLLLSPSLSPFSSTHPGLPDRILKGG